MTTHEPSERAARHLLRLKALEVAVELPAGLTADDLRETFSSNGRTVLVAVFAANAVPLALLHGGRHQVTTPKNECERDILATLAELGASLARRFTAPTLLRALDEKKRLHGDSTINQALARLVRVGLLVNAKDGRGYGLATPAEEAEDGSDCTCHRHPLYATATH